MAFTIEEIGKAFNKVDDCKGAYYRNFIKLNDSINY